MAEFFESRGSKPLKLLRFKTKEEFTAFREYLKLINVDIWGMGFDNINYTSDWNDFRSKKYYIDGCSYGMYDDIIHEWNRIWENQK